MSAKASKLEARPADVIGELGPFAGKPTIRGVTYDGERIWFAAGERLQSVDPETGAEGPALPVAGTAGTAFDGRYFFQIDGDEIQKIDSKTGERVDSMPVPVPGHPAGLAWAEGTLWLGMHQDRKIHQIDPKTGKVLRTIESTRYVTGVTWADGELWHGTWEDDQSELRRVDPESGEVLERLTMPPGRIVTGLEFDGRDRFFCGGGPSGTLSVVKHPKKKRVSKE